MRERFESYIYKPEEDLYPFDKNQKIDLGKTVNEIISAISKGNFSRGFEIREAKKLPEEILNTPEVLQAMRRGITELILNRKIFKKDDADEVISEKEKYNIPDDIFKQATEKAILISLERSGSLAQARNFLFYFNLPIELLKTPAGYEAAKNGLSSALQRGSVFNIKEISQYFDIEIDRQLIVKAFENQLQEGTLTRAKEICEEFQLSDNEIQESFKQVLIFNLTEGRERLLLYILKDLDFPQIINSPEILELAKKSFTRMINRKSEINFAQKFQIKFNIPKEFTDLVVKEKIIESMRSGEDAEYIVQLKEIFSLPEELLNSPEIQLEIKKIFIRESAILNNSQVAIKWAICFNLPNNAIIEVLSKRTQEALERGENVFLGELLKIRSVLGVSIDSPEIKHAAMQRLEKELNQGYLTFSFLFFLIEEFNLSDEVKKSPEIRRLARIAMEDYLNIDIGTAIDFNEVFSLNDQNLRLAYELLGDHIDKDSYQLVQKTREGLLDEKTKADLGIQKSGEAGIAQLKNKIISFRQSITSPEFDPEILLNSSFYRQYFKHYVRFDKSQWGSRNDDEFLRTTQNYLTLEDHLASLPDEYVQSGTVNISQISQEKQETFEYSQQFLTRFNVLKKSLSDALKLFDERKPFSKIAQEVETIRSSLLSDFQIKLEKTENPKVKRNLEQRIKELASLDLRSVKDFQKNFTFLSQFKEFQDKLRQLVFYYALMENKNFRFPAESFSKKEEMSFDDISFLIDFVEHIVNKETWSKYFTEKKFKKAFRGITNIKALEEEYSRAQEQETKGTVAMDFIPVRGFLMDFSGCAADACWASKYDSIAQEFPNFSAVFMLQNKEKRNERVAGAFLLIETEGEDGTPLLIIRGLNPIQNVINRLSLSDFFNKLVSYLRPIAEKRGRKLAIVIDNHSGGSSTNRPALFSFLEEKKKKFKHIPLKSAEDTTFNGYNITEDTYLIPDSF